jgi:Uri superfamily endonuclease
VKGVYVLILRMDSEKDIRIGKLGEFRFKKGFYAYVGSARGPGGFKRVKRHFDVAEGKNCTRKWHIDYLLPYSEIVAAVLSPTTKDLECNVAQALCEFSDSDYEGFGCSDCECRSHIFYSDGDFGKMVTDTCSIITGNESIIMSPHI